MAKRTQRTQQRDKRKPAEPPDDVLGIQAWAYQLVAQQMHDVSTDRSLAVDKRRELILKHAAALVPLIPKAAIHAAVDAMRGESDDMASAAHGPELEDASQFSRSGSSPKAKRGRPRKRSVL